ncbi:serine/threonine protein kinase [Calothrix sp. NIES-4071]|nr:serine/threonine protein kinase [Calothrix sp. NIES-4071]BAZ63684.1 serine/threonine protein kinase [Calothrix sp. NIES-4105]
MLQSEQVLQDRYQLQRLLGNNGVRQTWLARDLQADDASELVVVKLLAFGGAVSWDDLKLFEREAQILKQLKHPRIPQYIDYFCIDDRSLWFGLVEKYIPGESIKEKLASCHRFSEKQARKIAVDILKILIYLHSLNPLVLHRDVKPSNLIWGDDNQVYLVDFGAVQDKAAKEGVTFTVVGTYGYAPMEQFGGKAVPASDLYALGATIIHLLTGLPPSELPQRSLRIEFSHLVNISSDFSEWLQKLTSPAPEDRFATAPAALDALNNRARLKIVPQYKSLPDINNSGCGINSMAPVPEAVLGWNWGAFFMPYFWIWPNNVWVGLLCFLPTIGIVMTIALGAKGNEWAWKSRRWRSIEHFQRHQRGWAIAGLLIGGPISLVMWSIAISALITAFLSN